MCIRDSSIAEVKKHSSELPSLRKAYEHKEAYSSTLLNKTCNSYEIYNPAKQICVLPSKPKLRYKNIFFNTRLSLKNKSLMRGKRLSETALFAKYRETLRASLKVCIKERLCSKSSSETCKPADMTMLNSTSMRIYKANIKSNNCSQNAKRAEQNESDAKSIFRINVKPKRQKYFLLTKGKAVVSCMMILLGIDTR
eukprot:TRINITY_DN24580_c0_g2_i1.p1 TRINITY_DN24580_c0_g2~~TRINITY_DN24580_c0_g2_i1.p1  ORF type:complete len:196 (+),score=6.02 TRINITY_DN24580_c0_g2_i1:73-660(+)